MITSTRLSGGDWHWRLVGADIEILMDVGGYKTERECCKAVSLLQRYASISALSSGH